jgi:hypothetical protein
MVVTAPAEMKMGVGKMEMDPEGMMGEEMMAEGMAVMAAATATIDI